MQPEADGRRPTMRRPLQIAAVVIILAGLYVALESVDLKLYTVMGPGPGFFPLGLAIALCGLAGLMLFQATVRTSEAMPPHFCPAPSGVIRILAVLATLVAAMLLLEPLGMRLTFLAFIFLVPLLLGYRRPLIVLAVALAGSFGVFEVFARVLDIPLPVGAWGI